MNHIIRDMNERDWESVKNIYNRALMKGISTFRVQEYDTYVEWDESHLKDCRLVVMIEDNVVGWCALSKTSTREVYQGVVEVSIYMDERYTNLGLASKLIKTLCMLSEKKGYWSLYSSIISINASSILLHEKCGFRKIGIREKIAKDRFGKWQDVTLFEFRNSDF